MADKKAAVDNEKGDPKLLIAALTMVLIGSGWFVYEWLRPLTADEKAQQVEEERYQRELAKKRK